MLVAIFSAIGAAVVSGIFGVIMFILNRKAAKKDKEIGVAAGVQYLLYLNLKKLCADYLSAGYISTDDLKILVQMWQVYHGLGGNGYLDELINIVKKLPIKEK